MAAPSTLPAFAVRLLALLDEQRPDALRSAHPAYNVQYRSWQVQLDAFEGGGGFLDGSYLWEYPSESSDDYKVRKEMARYHNYVETLVDLYVRFFFTQGVSRRSKSPEYDAWLEDVDGAGCTIDDYLKRFMAISLVNGHAATLLDKTPDEPTGPSKADEQARVYATLYTAPTIVDWRFDQRGMAAVKLLEALPSTAIDDTLPEGYDAQRWLLWDREGWARFDMDGVLLDGAVANLDLVPLIVLRPKPSYLSPVLGRPLVSNANVIRNLFNRASEEDEVLRRQAFSVLTVNVPSDGDVQQARDQLSTVIGSAKALVVKGVIDYKTPDQSVPEAIRKNIEYLVQEVYRVAHLRFKRDSLHTETAEAIRLQHAELNEMLQGMAKALGDAEQRIARAWFAWNSPTPEQAQAAFEAAAVEATYPQEFFLDDLLTELEAWTEGIRMQLGDTLGRRLKKKAARRLDPECPADVLATIDGEIDALPVEPPSPFQLDTGPNATHTLAPDAVGMAGG